MGKPAAELRVHGVGGSSPHSILGLGSDDDAQLVAFGNRTGFWRRRAEPEIEGYVWGGLTSQSKLQPLWILLLPFTLVNVSGWMHDPKLRAWRVHLTRAWSFLFGLSLTATYVAWSFAMVVDSAGTKWLPQQNWVLKDHRLTPRYGLVAGVVVLGVLLIGLTWLAARAGRVPTDPSDPELTRADHTALFGVAATVEDSLAYSGFFRRQKDSDRLLAVHVFVVAALIAYLTRRAWPTATAAAVHGHSLEPRLWLQQTFWGIGIVQAGLLLALFATSVVFRTKDEPAFDPVPTVDPIGRPRRRFRWAGPAVACCLATLFANATFAGISRSLDNLLDVDVGHKFLFADVMTLGVAFTVIAGAVWMVRWHVFPTNMDAVGPGPEDVPLNTAAPGQSPNGASGSHRKQTARFRSITNGVTRVDAELTCVALAIVAVATWLALARIGDRHARTIPILAAAGSKLILAIGAALVGIIWLKRNDPKTRKTVGIIWDLLTFWPRRFHPFAIRPYTEQAVPELRGRIEALVTQHKRLVISCHSQGTVLTFAALAPGARARAITRALMPWAALQPEPIELVTYGSHLGGLFRVFFPAYFTHDFMETVHSGLLSWRNFRRRTDPIGSDIHSVQTFWLKTPDVTPAVPPVQPLQPPATPAEHDLDRWACVEVHSYYRNEPLMKQLIDQLRQ